mgnify:CR=1 FL=1
MGYQLTSTKILAVLNSVDVAVIPVKYEYLEVMPTSFPAGFVILEGGPPEKSADTVNNLVDMAFIVRTILPLEESQVATQKMLGVLDAILAKFRLESNRTLGGTVHNLKIEGNRPVSTDQYGQPCLVMDVRITAQQLASTQ